MKLIIAALLLFSFVGCSTTHKEAVPDWVQRPASDTMGREWIDLPSTDIWEVVASKEAGAIFELTSEPCVSLSERRAKYYTDHYVCPRGKKPFLVRAVYLQGGTGGYIISRRGNDLLVSHGSLGRDSDWHQSALVVNLDFVPTQIYVEAAMAR